VLDKEKYMTQLRCLKWVSVDDLLPRASDLDRFGRVLIYPSGNNSITTCAYSERFQLPYPHFKVTHWMSLPEEPTNK